MTLLILLWLCLLIDLLVKNTEGAPNQQNFVQPTEYQHQPLVSVPAADNSAMFVNQQMQYETAVPGQEEVMDHSGVYDSASQQVFTTVDNSQMTQQAMSTSGQVLMDISSGNPTGDYRFNYNTINVLQGQSFSTQIEPNVQSQSAYLPPNKQSPVSPPAHSTVLTSPVEQHQMMSYPSPQQQQQQQQQQHLPSPLEEIQAQQIASRGGNVLSPTHFNSNVDPFSLSRQTDTSNQARKGRLPRNVSDSQLYTMDLSQLGTTFQTNLCPSVESNLPPQLEAPNLVAHLQSIQPRTRLTAPPSASQAKRARLPRNMSDSRLSSLVSMCRSPTSPPSLPTVQSSDETNQPPQTSSGPAQSSTLSGMKGRKQSQLPRNMSDSSLLSLGQQPQRAPPPLPSQRRRKMSDPQQVLSPAALVSNLQGSAVQATAFGSSTESQLFNPSGNLQSGEAQILEQLLSMPPGNSNSHLNAVSSVSSVAQPTETYQSATSVLGQLLTQQSPVVSAPAVQSSAQDAGSAGTGNQDPTLLSQLYQLKQMLQSKQTNNVPSEILNALNSLTSPGAMQVSHQKQDQAAQPVVHQKSPPAQPSLQMKPKNQNAITQALQSLLRAPPNVSLHPSNQTKQPSLVSSLSSQPSFQAPSVMSNSTPIPSVTIKHQPQHKPPVSSTVIITPQSGMQPAQDMPTEQVPEIVHTSIPQLVNIEPVSLQGQRVILPANVNLSTLSLAQLGLTPATLQSVS